MLYEDGGSGVLGALDLFSLSFLRLLVSEHCNQPRGRSGLREARGHMELDRMESELDLDQIGMDWIGLDLVEICFILLYD